MNRNQPVSGILFLLVTVFLFSSCGFSPSIVKRKYQDGYYVHLFNKKMEPRVTVKKEVIDVENFQDNVRNTEQAENTLHALSVSDEKQTSFKVPKRHNFISGRMDKKTFHSFSTLEKDTIEPGRLVPGEKNANPIEPLSKKSFKFFLLLVGPPFLLFLTTLITALIENFFAVEPYLLSIIPAALWMLSFIASPVLLFFAIYYGVKALEKIHASKGKLRGEFLSFLSIIGSSFIVFLYCLVLMLFLLFILASGLNG